MNSQEYLDGFNYAEFLKRRLMVGVIDPWRKDSEGVPFYTTLVPLDTAINECKEWSGQDINRKAFLSHLKYHNVLVFSNIDEFVRYKDKKPKELVRVKRQISEEQRKALSERMSNINNSKKNPKPVLTEKITEKNLSKNDTEVF